MRKNIVNLFYGIVMPLIIGFSGMVYAEPKRKARAPNLSEGGMYIKFPDGSERYFNYFKDKVKDVKGSREVYFDSDGNLEKVKSTIGNDSLIENYIKGKIIFKEKWRERKSWREVEIYDSEGNLIGARVDLEKDGIWNLIFQSRFSPYI